MRRIRLREASRRGRTDVVLLSRAQFALAVAFHFLFPAITLGLSLVILLLETRVWRKGDAAARRASSFLIRILALVFTLGAATGIALSVSLGTNWSPFSRLVGNIFGVALAAEGILAFFLESAFLGVLVFGRDRVTPRMYWLAALLVVVGSHLSGIWIIIANSWMQTPAGYAVTPDGIVLTDFWAAVLNQSTLIRYVHTILAGWITGSFVVIAIAALYFLKGVHVEVSRAMLRPALALFIVAALLMPVAGHLHSVQVATTQPAKLAAYEGLWSTTAGAPMSLFGVPNEAAGTTDFYVGIPNFLSVLVYGNPNAIVQGLNAFPAADRPPVLVSFASYHVMILLGAVFVGYALVALRLWMKGRFATTRWFLRGTLLALPLPFVATEFGWIAAEVGRQPWTIYGILRTSDAATMIVPDWQILATLLLLAAVYGLLFVLFVGRFRRILAEGPAVVAAEGG